MNKIASPRRISLADNDSYAFRAYPLLTSNQRLHQELVPDMSGQPHNSGRRCPVCGELLDKWSEHMTGLVVKRRKNDLSVTYDGVVVISENFRQASEREEIRGLVLKQLPDDPSFYAISTVRAVGFDAERRKTRFIDLCSTCGIYRSVIGATPVFLKAGEHVEEDELVRTDLEFGSGDTKHPILLCGALAAERLSCCHLTGFDAIPIEKDA